MTDAAFVIDQWDFSTTPAQRETTLPTNLHGRWVHCQRDAPDLVPWLDSLGIQNGIQQALLAEDTRPRFEIVGDGFLLNLRGVNLNPGAEPDDMLSLRFLWHDGGLITLRKHSFRAVASVRERLASGDGPVNLGNLLMTLVAALNSRIDEVLDAQEAELVVLEDESSGPNPQEHLAKLTQLHRRLLRLHRFIRPQVGALNEFVGESETWLSHKDRLGLSNQRDTTQRILENIEMLLQQVQLIRDELQQNLAERMNRNTYWLSVTAGVFLPLSFLTGLFGINVGGMPGVESSTAFWFVCGALSTIAVVEFLLLRRLRFW
ncbi:magnesium transporter [Saccharospirillum sp. MSK14-1]|uniref:zinc transporter ZntB n=1 Tax=Saccharospirillum sp. MSK14-1 TaxID=1897632 RepID=UPI000D35132D|nr:zinc transporter ZntB [Saccharospirillum sp. MSK14-1]PTY36976.1 magnesium transporter [Saccharospirillum sp. MSK14-1]